MSYIIITKNVAGVTNNLICIYILYIFIFEKNKNLIARIQHDLKKKIHNISLTKE